MALLKTRPMRRAFLWVHSSLFALLLALTACGVMPASARAAEPISNEYQIKAVFLFNFAQFVEWPTSAFPSKTAPFVIGILGDDPFKGYIDDLVKEEKVGPHGFSIRRYRITDDLSGCHILFISRSVAGEIGAVLHQIERKHVLTVSDIDTFSRQGGMVRFATDSGKIKLRINVDIARANGLAISSKILRPATIVTAAKD